MDSFVSSLRIERILRALYLIALVGLLVLPASGVSFEFLGVRSDKWIHIILFAGLAALMRWNAEGGHLMMMALALAMVVVVATELIQGVINYRSVDAADVFAGALGYAIGVATMHKIIVSTVLRRLIGLSLGRAVFHVDFQGLIAVHVGDSNIHLGSRCVELNGDVICGQTGVTPSIQWSPQISQLHASRPTRR